MADTVGIPISVWSDLMASSVTIEPWVSQSVSGVPSYGTGVAYACYISMQNRVVVDSQGREVVARGRVIMNTATIIGVKDRITLPTGYVPTNPPIIAINVFDDELGSHHTTVDIG